jgi:hypothetical protein
MDINDSDLNGLLKQYGNLSETHWFYGESEQLRFDRKNWKWFRVAADGSFEPLYGVTGVLHIADLGKSEALIGWAKKVCMVKLRRLMIERAGQGSEDSQMRVFIGELDDIIRESKKANEEELDAASDTGRDAHGWIEQYIKSVLKSDTSRRDELLAKFPVDARAASCCVAAIDWMARHNVRWIATERTIYSRRFRYAGTMDGTALIDSCDDQFCCPTPFKDRFSLVDWKSSNALRLEYVWQTAAYQQAYEEEMGEEIQDRWIIRLGKEDGEFDPWHFERRTEYILDWHGYLACLELYKIFEQVDERISNIKKSRRAIEKEAERLKREEAHKIKCPKADDYKGSRKSKCLPDGTQCQTCREKYDLSHPKSGSSGEMPVLLSPSAPPLS